MRKSLDLPQLLFPLPPLTTLIRSSPSGLTPTNLLPLMPLKSLPTQSHRCLSTSKKSKRARTTCALSGSPPPLHPKTLNQIRQTALSPSNPSTIQPFTHTSPSHQAWLKASKRILLAQSIFLATHPKSNSIRLERALCPASSMASCLTTNVWCPLEKTSVCPMPTEVLAA